MTNKTARVLLLLATPGPVIGGMERQTALQANALSKNPELDIAIAASPCYQQLFSSNVRFFPINMKRSRRNPLLLRQISLAVKEFQPTLIHAHGHKSANLAKTLKRSNPGLKTVATVHGCKRDNHILTSMDSVICVSEGLKKQLSPIASIEGGTRYFAKIKKRIPKRIQEPDRTWFALASYNVGYGHLEDARILTEKGGKDPDKWIDVKEFLPLLQKKKYYKQTRYGYARGNEPVIYVQNIRRYYDVLNWMTQPQPDEHSIAQSDIQNNLIKATQ